MSILGPLRTMGRPAGSKQCGGSIHSISFLFYKRKRKVSKICGGGGLDTVETRSNPGPFLSQAPHNYITFFDMYECISTRIYAPAIF